MATVYLPTAQAMAGLWVPSVIDATLKAWPAVAAHYGFNTRKRCVDFFAEITWEANGGRELRENLYYRAPQIVAVFGVGHHSAAVTEDEAKKLERNPYQLGERVYGIGNPTKSKELGNDNPGDGFNFRGAGWLNATGKESIAKLGKALGIDFIAHPELLNDPVIGLWLAAEEYYQLGCLALSDVGDIDRERRRVNGGTNGLANVKSLIATFTKIFAAIDPIEVADTGIQIQSADVQVTLPEKPAPVPVPSPLAAALAPKPKAPPIILPSAKPAVDAHGGHAITALLVTGAGVATKAAAPDLSPIAFGVVIIIVAVVVFGLVATVFQKST